MQVKETGQSTSVFAIMVLSLDDPETELNKTGKVSLDCSGGGVKVVLCCYRSSDNLSRPIWDSTGFQNIFRVSGHHINSEGTTDLWDRIFFPARGPSPTSREAFFIFLFQ